MCVNPIYWNNSCFRIYRWYNWVNLLNLLVTDYFQRLYYFMITMYLVSFIRNCIFNPSIYVNNYEWYWVNLSLLFTKSNLSCDIWIIIDLQKKNANFSNLQKYSNTKFLIISWHDNFQPLHVLVHIIYAQLKLVFCTIYIIWVSNACKYKNNLWSCRYSSTKIILYYLLANIFPCYENKRVY